MTKKRCRVCGNKFFGRAVLRYKNVPRSAQYLPDANLVKKDKGIDLNVYQCKGCGLVQLINKPVSYYREVIRAVGISAEMKNFRKKQFADFVEKYSLLGKKMVEIGCGKGDFLSLIKQSGVDAYGIEYNGESVKQCINKGLVVTRDFIQSDNKRMIHAPFDAFFISNFLEHIPKPNLLLGGLFNNLTNNAVGLVEVPNFDMILAKKLFSEFILDHLFYFTMDSLRILLEKNGFVIIDCKVIWHDYIISVVVRKRERLKLSDFRSYEMKIKKEILKYVNRYKKEGVAIWGAGHQALTIISLANLGNKIKYIVDSASFKQGKYSPASHVPIVAPRVLDSDKVGAIVVMAGSYSDEVVKVIQEKYDNKIGIAVLRDYGLELIK